MYVCMGESDGQKYKFQAIKNQILVPLFYSIFFSIFIQIGWIEKCGFKENCYIYIHLSNSCGHKSKKSLHISIHFLFLCKPNKLRK